MGKVRATQRGQYLTKWWDLIMGSSIAPLVLSQDPDYLDVPGLCDPSGLVAAPKTSLVDQQTSAMNPSQIHQNTGPPRKTNKQYPNLILTTHNYKP